VRGDRAEGVDIMSIFVPSMIGYLLGSMLPAYFLTRLILGIDIRSVGTFHAGTTNVFRVAGLWPAVVTAFYDTTKGILAIQISRAMGYPDWASYLSGLCAVVGHVYPFYLQFRGGKGAATTVGLLLFFLWHTWLKLPMKMLLPDLLILLSMVLTIFWISRKGDVVGIFVLPALEVVLWLRMGAKIWFAEVLIGILLYINLKNIVERKLIQFSGDVRKWRILIRPVSILLIFLGFNMGRNSFLLLTGIVLGIFFLMDVIRLMSRRVGSFFHEEMNFKLFKEVERKKISSMTLFLLGVLLTFLLFEKNIAVVSSCFLILGDLSAKVIGMSFGKKKFFEKTLEGSLAHLVVSIYVAYIAYIMNLMSLHVGFVGAITATICEILPLSIDDNVSVPIFSALTMSLWKIL